MKLKANKGTILVEVILAISIITVGLLAVLRLLSNSISLNKTVSNQLVATYLAEEGIEVAKNILDANVIKIGLGNDPQFNNSNQWNKNFTPGDYEIDYQSQTLENNQNRFLFFDQNTGRYSYDPAGSETIFRRRIDIDRIGNDELRIAAKVDWAGRKGATSTVVLEDHFFNWRCDYPNFPSCP